VGFILEGPFTLEQGQNDGAVSAMGDRISYGCPFYTYWGVWTLLLAVLGESGPAQILRNLQTFIYIYTLSVHIGQGGVTRKPHTIKHLHNIAGMAELRETQRTENPNLHNFVLKTNHVVDIFEPTFTGLAQFHDLPTFRSPPRKD